MSGRSKDFRLCFVAEVFGIEVFGVEVFGVEVFGVKVLGACNSGLAIFGASDLEFT